ncbi:hypothetical protein B0T24DRAFT_631104 [Lasiosphaeria ovina]|uniref:Uncharacterized protein n=1 Tax=Lasiosphaeria ovina TaxID=92902 RepID=A0AAE0K2M5_9PEZI|nr:hypothetical protein B0T24DRAFT_631104 [Lasiosphaeria ovina]
MACLAHKSRGIVSGFILFFYFFVLFSPPFPYLMRKEKRGPAIYTLFPFFLSLNIPRALSQPVGRSAITTTTIIIIQIVYGMFKKIYHEKSFFIPFFLFLLPFLLICTYFCHVT